MAEGIDTDSRSETEQAAPAPAKPINEMGMGFNAPDTPAGTPPSETEQSDDGETRAAATKAAASTTTTDSGNGAVDETERRAAGLRQADYTRKTQELAEQRRSFEQERERFQGLQQQWMSQLQQLQQPPSPGRTLSTQLEQAMADPNLSQADRMGLNVLSYLNQTLESQSQTISQLRERLEKFEPTFQQTHQQVTALTQEQNEARVRQIQQQLDESYTLFGEEATQGAAEFVKRNLGMRSPTSGEPYTIAELVGLATGKSRDETNLAQQTQRASRTNLKRVAANQGASHSLTESAAGPISRAEALRQIRDAM